MTNLPHFWSLLVYLGSLRVRHDAQATPTWAACVVQQLTISARSALNSALAASMARGPWPSMSRKAESPMIAILARAVGHNGDDARECLSQHWRIAGNSRPHLLDRLSQRMQ
jgi:hypothetical protein